MNPLFPVPHPNPPNLLWPYPMLALPLIHSVQLPLTFPIDTEGRGPWGGEGGSKTPQPYSFSTSYLIFFFSFHHAYNRQQQHWQPSKQNQQARKTEEKKPPRA